MKQAALFLVKFVCLTAPFIWLWQVVGLRLYYAIYSPIASAVYELLGFEGIATPARDRYVNIVPFLTLMALTPGLSRRRRFGGAAIGLLVLFASHIAANCSANPRTLQLPQMVTLLMDASPFFLWAVIAHRFVRGLISPGVVAAMGETGPNPPRDGQSARSDGGETTGPRC
jgi:hypothetical protein